MGSNKRDEFIRASVGGESLFKSSLYPMSVPEDELADFGIGVGLYFSNLRIMGMILFFAFIIQTYTVIYFAGPNYSDGQSTLSYIYWGSAACTIQQWHPCTDCKFDATTQRFTDNSNRATSITAEDGTTLDFIKVNECEVNNVFVGLASWAAFVFVLCAIGYMRFYEKKRAVEYDLNEQTAADYSINVTNPPLDARDPEGQCHSYFSLSYCTI